MTKPSLKRSISLPLLIFYGLGNILGAGIYVLVGKVAGIAGLYAPFAFLVAALVATFTAFTYAELSSRFPLSAGEAIYIENGFNRSWLSIATGFLIILGGMVSAATIAKGAVGYLNVLIPVPGPVVIVVLLVTLGAVAVWGITQSMLVAAMFTLMEIIGLLLIVWIGRDALLDLPQHLPNLLPPLQADAWSAIMIAGFLAFFAYIGFEDMVNVAEEVKNPEHNVPVGIIAALIISTLIYGLVVLVAVLSVTPTELAASDSPLALVYEQRTQQQPTLITSIGLVAVVNGALIQIVMASRVLYGMSNRGWLPELLGRVNAVTHTPIVATLIVTLSIIILALFVPLITLASITSLLLLVVFSLLNLSLLFIKKVQPARPGVKVVPHWIPIGGFLTCLGLILARFFLNS